jgi:hypothetical protein
MGELRAAADASAIDRPDDARRDPDGTAEPLGTGLACFLRRPRRVMDLPAAGP